VPSTELRPLMSVVGSAADSMVVTF
jgi:hypothetical protein